VTLLFPLEHPACLVGLSENRARHKRVVADSRVPLASNSTVHDLESQIDLLAPYHTVLQLFLCQGNVCKVRKRHSALGGSARREFVKIHGPQPEPQMKDCQCFAPFIGAIAKILPRRESLVVVEEREEADFDSSNNQKMSQYFALKSLHLDRCSNRQLQNELLNEVAILRELDHAHIARAIETFAFDGQLYICLEMFSGGDLYSRDPYTEEEAARILGDILSAVSYLHARGIIHRDLKFENIMFVDQRPEAEVKLIDFGLSQKFVEEEEHLSQAMGTV
jgi:serine/threonine protein kinase